MKLAVGLTILITLLVVTIMGCTSLGTRPSSDTKKQFETSEQYNKEKGIFENRRPQLIAEMQDNNMSWKMIKEWFAGGNNRVPAEPLPEAKPDLTDFAKKSDELKVIWFGHSSFLLNMDGKSILVDPVFGGAASPVSFMVNRFQKPVLKLHELPEIDYVVISHDHYDHLDKTSIKYFVDKKTQFITPLGVGSHLLGWGISSERIIEKDWWQSANFNGVEFTATPAQHFSGRNGLHGNETLWASWVIRSKNHNIYFSGDSGYDTHFKIIGQKYGPFDVAFIESGQYNENWKEVHMHPVESVEAFRDLRSKRYFPVHWGMFELAMHSWYDPIERLAKLSSEQGFELVAPKLGQVVSLNSDFRLEKWWKPSVQPKLVYRPIEDVQIN